VRFQLLVRDASPVSHFTLFFQSGDGWYSARFSPAEKGRWHTVTVDKDETQIEGRPAGWAAVRTVRISAWRGRDEDAEICVAGFAAVGGAAPIALVRGESATRGAPAEVEAVCRYAAAAAACLKDLGLDHMLISDDDLSAGRLRGVRLAVLPHNPAMPDGAADVLSRYVAGGGKLLAFYVLPPALRQALGVEGGDHVPQKYRGHFASVRFEPGALAGAPDAAGQLSWNICGVRPVEGRSRAVARWFDSAGADTGRPAVLLSDNGIYMTHVMTGEDMPNKGRMLLAMVGRFLPEAWRQASEASLDRLARFDKKFDDSVRPPAIPPPQLDGFARSLNQARARAAEARALVLGAEYAEAMNKADAAHRFYVDAWCRAQPGAAPGEHRAFWCHSAFGPAGMSWDEAIKILADNGFTAILPNMLWGGAAYYESAVLPVPPEVKDKGDQVAACLAACKKHGLECHVWKVNYNMGGRAPREFRERMKRDGRTQVGFDGRPRDSWLCPSHPDNRKLEIDSMVEVASKYDVAGIHFDYIRYPDADHCFCPGCRERFQEAAGVKVAAWPADVRRDAALAQKWLDWRRDNVTAVVAAVSGAVRKTRPKCKVSAAVFQNWAADRDKVGQDWRLWCERGYLDFVCPMDYTPHNRQFENLVAMQLPLAGSVPCYPGIGLSTWQPQGDVMRLIEQIQISRRLGCRGFTIFEFSALEARQVVPLCGAGVTRVQSAK